MEVLEVKCWWGFRHRWTARYDTNIWDHSYRRKDQTIKGCQDKFDLIFALGQCYISLPRKKKIPQKLSLKKNQNPIHLISKET